MSGPRGRARARAGGYDRGAGLVGTIAGVAVFLALLTVAMQLLLHLRATSTVRAAAYDAARVAATTDLSLGATALDRAEARGRAVLGGLAEGAVFEWDTSDPTVVRLRLTAPAPDLLAPAVDGALGVDRVESDVVVRREHVQP